MDTVFISHSPAETEKFAAKLSEELKGGEILAFVGGLGMGKTCFVRGLAKGLGFCGNVSSPTFALVNEYSGGRLPLFHFDMYRISTWDELYSTGYFDYMESGGVMAVEWSENIEAALDGNVIKIIMETVSENERKITVCRGDL